MRRTRNACSNLIERSNDERWYVHYCRMYMHIVATDDLKKNEVNWTCRNDDDWWHVHSRRRTSGDCRLLLFLSSWLTDRTGHTQLDWSVVTACMACVLDLRESMSLGCPPIGRVTVAYSRAVCTVYHSLAFFCCCGPGWWRQRFTRCRAYGSGSRCTAPVTRQTALLRGRPNANSKPGGGRTLHIARWHRYHRCRREGLRGDQLLHLLPHQYGCCCGLFFIGLPVRYRDELEVLNLRRI